MLVDLLLVIILFTILIAVLGLLCIRRKCFIRQWSLFSSLVILLECVIVFVFFDECYTGYQFVCFFNWIPDLFTSFSLGVDGISLFLILLTSFLIVLCVVLGWNTSVYLKEYFLLLFVLEFCLIVSFVSLDFLIFYVFFEAILVPMFIIIGIWGSRARKVRAALMLFVYTLISSLLMLISLLIIYYDVGCLHIEVLRSTTFTEERQLLLWIGIFLSFAVKVPMIPFHIWLPEAHVEAPTAGSVILAGILLKLGGYGMIRFLVPLFPFATNYYTPLIILLSVVGMVYTSLTTLRQIDMKRIIAYSSVGHMSYVVVGIFSQNVLGMEGALFLMLSHGLVSSGLFVCVGLLYDNYKTKLVTYYSGLVCVMPLFSAMFLLLIFGNISVPLTSSFIGEFITLVGFMQCNLIAGVIMGLGMILGAGYSLWLLNRICFGELSIYSSEGYKDISFRDFSIIFPLLLLMFILGVFPMYCLNALYSSVVVLLY